MALKVIDEAVVSPAFVRETLEKVKESSDLNFKSLKLLEYLNRTVTLSVDDTKKMIQKLKDLDLVRLSDKHIIKIIEILPPSKDVLRNVLTSLNTTLPDEEVEKIMEVVNEFN